MSWRVHLEEKVLSIYKETYTVFHYTHTLSNSAFFVLQYKDGKKLKPKPNYNSVDLSEVEWEDKDEMVNISFSISFEY